jgi:DNA repair protein SbcD/Mre11
MKKLASNSKNDTKEEALSICHISDVHLGYRRYNRLNKQGANQREADVNLAFSESVSRIIALKPSLTVIAGDLFHSVRPSNLVVTFCFRELRRLVNGTQAPVIIVSGNHESPKRLDTGFVLRLFAEIPNVYVADDKTEQFTFPEMDLSVCCIPHAGLENIATQVVRANDKFKYNILVTHVQLIGQWMSDFGGAEISLQAISPHEWDYVALGHVHVRKDINYNISYSGSIEHTASNIWAESQENKGFLQVFLPSKRRVFHSLASPRVVMNLKAIDAVDMDAAQVVQKIAETLEDVPGGIDGKILRLEILNIPREILKSLDHKQIRDWKSRCLNLTLDFKSPQTSKFDESLVALRGRKLTEELSLFCEGLDSQRKEKIKECILKYFNKVEAEDETATA